ncbi:hypothetical protein [Asaia sp. As-1742]|uniref:hypothetical protein n=1 Tax=Asaia sp. As-1742 TaxID=2608325 RepID=UPI0014203FF6|nr:hypothetical protein [Asaia sp. As-1742]NIE81480.1 hypothetical protein [Asaia sp. As-1742]
MRHFLEIVDSEIALVENEAARTALHRGYDQSTTALSIIEGFFDEFARKRWSEDALCVFAKNWRSPGTGAASFCALAFRLLSLAEQTPDRDKQFLLFRSATRLAEVSHEDTGIGGIDHQQLYEQFADALCGTDEWKRNSYRVTGAKDFMASANAYRQNGQDLGKAITISLPEELYNFGEFTFAAPYFGRWHKDVIGKPVSSLKADLKFVYDHLGSTESGHFASVVMGLEDYCNATGQAPDWGFLETATSELLFSYGRFYESLLDAMKTADGPKQIDVIANVSKPMQQQPRL